MGSVNSTNASRSTASDFERRKSLAAERMYRNHYNSSNKVNSQPTYLSLKQKMYKYSHQMSDKNSAIAAQQSLEADEGSEFDTPSKLAFSPTQTHRGLRNLAGENNCFLNVTIQALWHIGPFRHQLQMLIAKKAIAKEKNVVESVGQNKSILDALCNLFYLYQYTELSFLPPTELRTTLSDLFAQFQLGAIADANETLEAILDQIHNECLPACSHSTHKCLAHTVFGGLLMEQASCSECSETSVPMLRSDYVHYVYAAELISLATAGDNEEHKDASFHTTQSSPRGSGGNHHDHDKKRFGKLLHNCMGVSPRCCPSGDTRSQSVTPMQGSSPATVRSEMMTFENHFTDLPNSLHNVSSLNTKCKGKANVTLFALEPPMALAISIGWTSTRESATTLTSFLSLMSYTIQLSDLFDLSQQGDYNDAKDGLNSNHSNASPHSETWKDNDGDVSECGSVHSDHYCYTINERGEGSVSGSGEETKSGFHSPLRYSCSTDDCKNVSSSSTHRPDIKSPSYVFRGFVCYYGLHYVSVFQDHSNSSGAHAQFLLFDDQKVRPLGSWEDVKKECLKSLYQPVLLLYELQDADSHHDFNSVIMGHDEKERQKEKEREREKEKDDVRGSFIFRNPSRESNDRGCSNESSTISLTDRDKIGISSSTSSSSPRKKDIHCIGNKSVLRQMFQEADAATIAIKTRTSSPPPPYTSLSPISTSVVSSSLSLASYNGKKNSMEDLILSPSPSKDEIYNIQKSEFNIKMNLSDDELMKDNKFLNITVYENRPLISYVTLMYENYKGKKLLGFEHGMDENGHVVVVNFPKHPITGKSLATETSGQIFLMDELIGLDNISLIDFSTQQVREIFTKYASDTTRQMVMLTVKSSTICNLWYQCPYCFAEICIEKKEENELRKLHNANRSNVYDNMLTDRISNAKNDVSAMTYTSNKNVHILICTCTKCKKKCSAEDIFQFEQYM